MKDGKCHSNCECMLLCREGYPRMHRTTGLLYHTHHDAMNYTIVFRTFSQLWVRNAFWCRIQDWETSEMLIFLLWFWEARFSRQNAPLCYEGVNDTRNFFHLPLELCQCCFRSAYDNEPWMFRVRNAHPLVMAIENLKFPDKRQLDEFMNAIFSYFNIFNLG